MSVNPVAWLYSHSYPGETKRRTPCENLVSLWTPWRRPGDTLSVRVRTWASHLQGADVTERPPHVLLEGSYTWYIIAYKGALDGGSPMSPVNLKKWQYPLSLFKKNSLSILKCPMLPIDFNMAMSPVTIFF